MIYEKTIKTTAWIILIANIFLSSLYISWMSFQKIDFLYSVWHDLLEIDKVVELIAPHHLNKTSFNLTDKNERVRLFSEINNAVHHDIEALPLIEYATPTGKVIDTMLTEPEIIHLKDVAHLITSLHILGQFTTLITALSISILFYYKITFPPIKTLLKGSLIVISLVGIITIIGGPKSIFYQMHIYLFPDNHQWFFYYEESLMSLIMRAPALFGYLAALLVCTASLSTIAAVFIISLMLNRFSHQSKRETTV